MPYRFENHGADRAVRCAVCKGKFGLVRHYSWRTQLCSRNCVDRFKTRRQTDWVWMGWFQSAFNPPSENRARASCLFRSHDEAGNIEDNADSASHSQTHD